MIDETAGADPAIRASRVPSESYVPDGVWEEERIMRERAALPPSFDADSLRVPVTRLNLRSPTTLPHDATVLEAVRAMRGGGFGCVLVVALGRLVGIVTERDVLSRVDHAPADWLRHPLSSIMTPDPETLTENANLAFALNVMTVGGFRHVPIVDADDRPVAVVSIRDIVAYICSFFREEVANLPPRPSILHPTTRESV